MTDSPAVPSRRSPGEQGAEPSDRELAQQALEIARRVDERIGTSAVAALGTPGTGILGALDRLHDGMAAGSVRMKAIDEKLDELLEARRAAPLVKRRPRNVWAAAAALVLALGTATTGVVRALQPPPAEARPEARHDATGGKP